MSDRVLFMGWNRPVVGRENIASELFNSMVAYLTKQQQAGTITGFEPVLLNPHGGDMNGFFLIRGTHEKLSTLSAQEDYLNLVTQCGMNVDGFGVINGFGGEGVLKQMNRWRNYIQG